MSQLPPYYVLVAHGGALLHPQVEYHYADDAAHALLPRTPDECVLVLDYAQPDAPVAHSLSPALALTGLRTPPAPGATLADDDVPHNPTMYILESASVPDDPPEDDPLDPAHAALALFKQRNALLRSALDYPDPPALPALADHLTASPSAFNPSLQ